MRNTVVSYVREFFFSKGIEKGTESNGPTSAEVLKARLIADRKRQAELDTIKNTKSKKKKGGK